MFTGLVQCLGSLRSLGQYELQILWDEAGRSQLLPGLEIGDSIAVDGTCLTVETFDRQGFTAAVSPETLRRTALGDRLAQGVSVNLESSLRVGSKIGGHFVTGHVDGVGQFIGGDRTATSWELWFHAPPAVARYIVPKGSIAVNGISLTVASVQTLAGEQGAGKFMVAVIPHTYDHTNLEALQSGMPVNLEGDVLGKYVEKLVAGGRSPAMASMPTMEINGNGTSTNGHESNDWLTPEFLADHGYG
ncbi:MAG: riboflavin synthase [Cyanophyceae cyanobacterium]